MDRDEAPAGAIAPAGPDFEAASPDLKAAGPDFEAAGPDFEAAGPDSEVAGPDSTDGPDGPGSNPFISNSGKN